MADRSLRLRLARSRARVADLCLIAISAAVWTAGVLLAGLGCLLLFGIVIAGGEASRLAAQVQNLASHYLAATPAAQLKFEDQVAGLYAGTVVLLAVAHGPVFVRRLRRDLAGSRHGG